MIDNSFDKRGAITFLAHAIGVNRNSLSMALSGYRQSSQILLNLQKYLLNNGELDALRKQQSATQTQEQAKHSDI